MSDTSTYNVDTKFPWTVENSHDWTVFEHCCATNSSSYEDMFIADNNKNMAKNFDGEEFFLPPPLIPMTPPVVNPSWTLRVISNDTRHRVVSTRQNPFTCVIRDSHLSGGRMSGRARIRSRHRSRSL